MMWESWSTSVLIRSRMSALRSITASSRSISTDSPVAPVGQVRTSLLPTIMNGRGSSYRTVTRRWPDRMNVTGVVFGVSVSDWHINVAVMYRALFST